MGLIIIFLILLVVSIIVLVINECNWWSDVVNIICIITIILSGMGNLFCGGLALRTQIPKQKNYEEALYRKQVIEYRLKNQHQNLIGNELLYNDIVEFNNELRVHKRYSDSFWIGAFHNDKIATIDYIEIDGVDNYKD